MIALVTGVSAYATNFSNDPRHSQPNCPAHLLKREKYVGTRHETGSEDRAERRKALWNGRQRKMYSVEGDEEANKVKADEK